MEILFLCHRIPYPPDKGDKIRSHALLKHLAKRHRVHLACFVDDPADMAHTETVRQLAGGECIFVPLGSAGKFLSAAKAILSGQPITTAWFGSRSINQWVSALVRARKIDRAFVFSSAMAPYVLDSDKLDPQDAILDLVDIDSDKWRQYAAHLHGARRWVYRREAEKLFALERTGARRFGATLLVSPYEAESFAAMVPEASTRIYPLANGVNSEYFAPGKFRSPFAGGEIPVVMTGRMDYRPNVDGAEWFFQEVMPLLEKDLPQARFYVVGANPPASLSALAGPKMVVTGQVDDVRPYLQHAETIVAPLRIARGVQNKVLEAMAMAKPVVATQAATRALGVTSGVHLWIEDSPSGFAQAVVAAIGGTDRFHVARSARNYVERHHNWPKNLAFLDELLERDRPGSDKTHRRVQESDQFVSSSETQSVSSVSALQ
jgi:sugar transferase (PEP-CTERM/EpsH1 system associated)